MDIRTVPYFKAGEFAVEVRMEDATWRGYGKTLDEAVIHAVWNAITSRATFEQRKCFL